MDIVQHIRKLFAYDDWANRSVLASMRIAGGLPEHCLDLMGHIIGAERLWLARVRGEEEKPAVWPKLTLDQCDAELADVVRQWRHYLTGLGEGDLARQHGYVTSNGKPWSSSALDVLAHVVIHAAYHRGQIAAELRAAGHVPANTDYIHAVREGLVH